MAAKKGNRNAAKDGESFLVRIRLEQPDPLVKKAIQSMSPENRGLMLADHIISLASQSIIIVADCSRCGEPINATEPAIYWDGVRMLQLNQTQTEIVKNAPSRTGRNFDHNGTKYSMFLSAAQNNIRIISVWVKSGKLKGKAYEVGSIDVESGVVTSRDTDLFAADEKRRYQALQWGIESIVGDIQN